mgnify:CR=1 FL=1
MSGRREIRKPVTEEDIRRWEKAWSEMMVTIWRENILRLGIVDTMTLHDNISHRVVDNKGQIAIVHQFMLYGLFVARGVGNGYRHGNSGKDDENGLRFLDKGYRKAHKMGKPRQRRDWLFPRYLSSIDVLTEVERSLYGEQYMGTLANVVGAMFGNVTVKGDKGTVVTGTVARR